MTTRSEFRIRLQELINGTSMEVGSATPDFILATYLSDCLHSFDAAVAARDRFFGRPTQHLNICQSTCGESHRYDVTCCFGSRQLSPPASSVPSKLPDEREGWEIIEQPMTERWRMRHKCTAILFVYRKDLEEDSLTALDLQLAHEKECLTT